MTWDHFKAILYLIAFVLIIIMVGQFGWPIILGTISVIIIAILYFIVRVFVEYPED